MLCLKAVTQGCSLKYVLFKTRQTRHNEQRYERITMIDRINIIILVMQICCIGNSAAIHTTM